MKFFIVDVFGETRYSGNQLAVFMAKPGLTSEEMQKIASEIHFSETTFILKNFPVNEGYDVRIFTPEHEVDFAGHPTLGTAYIIKKFVIGKPVDKVSLNLKVGRIPVFFSKDKILRMKQNEPVFGKIFGAKEIMGILSLPIEASDEGFPIQEISTGLPHIIVPLKNIEYLKKTKIQKDILFSFIEKTQAKVILIFCPQGRTQDHDISVRMFADYYGITEDPATGSGNGCLAGYLVKYSYFSTKKIDIKAGQGYEINRPSLLFLQAKEENGHIEVSVGGKVIYIAKGEWE